MISFIVALIVSACVNLVLVRSRHVHGHRSGDFDFGKPQGFHSEAVPRIGGLGIALALLASTLPVALIHGSELCLKFLLLLACALPAFLAGFIQDITEALTPRGRLFATAMSAVLAFVFMDAGLVRTGFPGLDWVAGFAAGSLLLTVITAAGISNAVNIIDGFNGLASMCVAIMLAAVAYVAYQVGDELIGLMALAGIGASLGFFIWNYPNGLIFMGDGGAYLLGFYLAELCILLMVRNPGISPLFALLVCMYPTFETLFSVYRRRFLRAQPPSLPDGIHLHSLIYRRVIRWALGPQDAETLARKNSMTSPYLWILCSASVMPAVLFWDMPSMLAVLVAAYGMTYVALYWRIVRFRSPRWMHAMARRPRRLAQRDNRGS